MEVWTRFMREALKGETPQPLPGGWSGDCEEGFVACFFTLEE